MNKLVLASVLAVTTLGAVGAAVAQPPPPRGWHGPHYWSGGRWYHHRRFYWGPGHHRAWRYY